MKRIPILLLAMLCSGCLPIQKHLVIEGKNISTPYGKGDEIKITRDVCYGAKCEMPKVVEAGK